MADFSMEADLTFNVDKVIKDLENKFKNFGSKLNLGGGTSKNSEIIDKKLLQIQKKKLDNLGKILSIENKRTLSSKDRGSIEKKNLDNLAKMLKIQAYSQKIEDDITLIKAKQEGIQNEHLRKIGLERVKQEGESEKRKLDIIKKQEENKKEQLRLQQQEEKNREKILKISELEAKKDAEKQKSIQKQNEIFAKTAQYVQVIGEKTKQFETKEQLKGKYMMKRLREKDEYRQKVREERQPVQQLTKLFAKILPKPVKGMSGDIAQGLGGIIKNIEKKRYDERGMSGDIAQGLGAMGIKGTGKVAGQIGLILIAIDLIRKVINKVVNNEFSGYMKATKKIWGIFVNMMFKSFADVLGILMLPIMLKLLYWSIEFNKKMQSVVDLFKPEGLIGSLVNGGEEQKSSGRKSFSQMLSEMLGINLTDVGGFDIGAMLGGYIQDMITIIFSPNKFKGLENTWTEIWNQLSPKLKEYFKIPDDSGLLEGIWNGVVEKVKLYFGFDTNENLTLETIWSDVVEFVKQYFGIDTENGETVQLKINNVINVIEGIFGLTDEKKEYVQGKIDELVTKINNMFKYIIPTKEDLQSYIASFFPIPNKNKNEEENIEYEETSPNKIFKKDRFKGLENTWTDIWNTLTTDIVEIFKIPDDSLSIENMWTNIVENVKTFFGYELIEEVTVQSLWDNTVSFTKQFFMIDGMNETVQSLWDNIVSFIKQFFMIDEINETVQLKINSLISSIEKIFNITDVKENYAQNKLDKLTSSINSIFDKAEEKKDALSSWVDKQLSKLKGGDGKGERSIGGIVPTTGNYLLHSGEYVMDRNKTGEYFSNRNSPSSTKQDINININVSGATSGTNNRDIADLVAKEIKRYSSRSGLSFGGM